MKSLISIILISVLFPLGIQAGEHCKTAANKANKCIFQEKKDIMYYFELMYGKDLNEYNQYIEFEVQDISNGYVKFTGAFEGWIELVLWRTGSGMDLIGECSTGCGPACFQSLTFYQFPDGIQEDVTDYVFPGEEVYIYAMNKMNSYIEENPVLNDEPNTIWYDLPRYGTSVNVSIYMGQMTEYEITIPVMEVGWNKAENHFYILNKL